jgi:pimeloyl-ACP methyl ester carboxylesterase
VSYSLGLNARGALQLAKETVESWRAPCAQVVWKGCADGDSILLLHGLAQTPRMLQPLRSYLSSEMNRPTLDLPLGVGLGDIRDTAIRVHRQLGDQRVRRCDVVGYSLGGLVATYLLKCLDQGRCIRRVITLGTPHRGVPMLADWRRLLTRWWRSGDQMRAGSEFLEQLVRIPPPSGTSILSIAGADDAIVPPSAARVDGRECRNLVVPGLNHWTLPASRRVLRCVKQVLDASAGTWPPPHLERVSPEREANASRPVSMLGALRDITAHAAQEMAR